MKKYLFYFFALCLTACSNDDLTSNSIISNNTEPDVSTVIISGDKVISSSRATAIDSQLALNFKDFASFEKFKTILEEKSDDEKISIVKKYGITTLHDIAIKADQELEEIGKNATSENEFRKLYKEYKNRYKGILVSNEKNDSDLTLYVPSEENTLSYIANCNMVYAINNRIIKADLKQEVPSYAKNIAQKLTSTEPTTANFSEFSPKSGKKVYFQAYLNGIRMWVRMYCRKKMWYGWKNDPNRSYYYCPSLNNFVYLDEGPDGQEKVVMPLPMYIHNQNVSNGFNYILGRIERGNHITGKIYAWTDMTSEYDENGNEIRETVNGYTMPKCLQSKAQIVNINLTNPY